MIYKLIKENCMRGCFCSLVLQSVLLVPPVFGCCSLTVTSPINGEVVSTEFVTVKGSVASTPYPSSDEADRAFSTTWELRTYAGGDDWGNHVFYDASFFTASVEETNSAFQAGDFKFKPPSPGGYRLIIGSYSMACVEDDACGQLEFEDAWKEIFFYYQYDPCVNYLHSLDDSCAASGGAIEIHVVPGAGPANTTCVNQQPICSLNPEADKNNNAGPPDTC